MSDHTQAPWTISPVRTVDGEYMVVGGPGKEFGLIAAVTEEADARLIAAAPDLLDALKQCAEYLGSIPAGGTREPLYIAYKAAIDLIERTEGAGPSAGQPESNPMSETRIQPGFPEEKPGHSLENVSPEQQTGSEA